MSTDYTAQANVACDDEMDALKDSSASTAESIWTLDGSDASALDSENALG